LSERKESHPLLFFGWWIVVVAGTISGIGFGFNSYSISVFFKDLAAELGLSRAITSLATGIGRLEGGIASPLAGWLADKFGPKWPIILGICVGGIGMMLMNFITTMWQYIVVWGLLVGAGVNLGLTVAIDKSLNDWFLRKRGLAQGIKFAFMGAFSVVTLQVVTPLVLSYGWRTTCFIWGIVMFACVPLAFAYVRNQRPEHYGLLPDGAKIGLDTLEDRDKTMDGGAGSAPSLPEPEYSFRQTIRTRVFWILVVAYSLQNLVGGGFTIHVVPFLTDLGIDTTTASGMMGMMVFFTVPSRFLGGLIVDHVRKSRCHFLLAGAFSLQFVGVSAFLLFQNMASIYVLLVCNGLSTGAAMPILIVTLGRYFGRQAFGSIFGTLLAFLSPVLLIAPVYSGWVYDTTGSYINAFITFDVLVVFAVSIMFFIRPPK
jgi:cyanate permease